MVFDIDYQNNSLEFGCCIDKDFSKKGLMRESILILEKFFSKQGAHHFTMKCANDNLASKHLIESLGYELEGIQKENRLYIGAKEYRDTLIFGKIANSFIR